jgi:hypothetical protein
MSLCLVLERGVEPARATAFLQAAAQEKGRLHWLAPPASRGAISIKDVHAAGNATDHERLVCAWAESTWSAWATDHGTVRRWLAETKFVTPRRSRS